MGYCCVCVYIYIYILLFCHTTGWPPLNSHFLVLSMFTYPTQIHQGQIHGFSCTLLKSMCDCQSFGETCCTLIGECSFSETVVNTNQILVKTLRPHQSVNAVQGNNRCLFSDPYRTHKYSVWAECGTFLNVKTSNHWALNELI